MLQSILNLIGLGRDALQARSRRKIAEIDAGTKRVQSDAGWEAYAAQNAANSFLDEWWTFVLSFPLIASFVPWLVPYVRQGFEALEIVPEWYVWAVLASISFAFARKRMPDLSAWLTRKKG